VSVSSVAVSPVNVEITEGESTKLTAKISPAAAAERTVTWTSSDKSVATVDDSGNVAGLAAGYSYKALTGRNRLLAVIVAAVVCPVLNTGIFLLGCKLFFMETITGWGTALGYEDVGSYIIYGLIGGNFLFELLFNVVLSPVIVRLIRIGKKEVE